MPDELLTTVALTLAADDSVAAEVVDAAGVQAAMLLTVETVETVETVDTVATVPMLPMLAVPAGSEASSETIEGFAALRKLTTAVPVTAANAVMRAFVNPLTSDWKRLTSAEVMDGKLLPVLTLIRGVPPSVTQLVLSIVACRLNAPVYVPVL